MKTLLAFILVLVSQVAIAAPYSANVHDGVLLGDSCHVLDNPPTPDQLAFLQSSIANDLRGRAMGGYIVSNALVSAAWGGAASDVWLTLVPPTGISLSKKITITNHGCMKTWFQ